MQERKPLNRHENQFEVLETLIHKVSRCSEFSIPRPYSRARELEPVTDTRVQVSPFAPLEEGGAFEKAATGLATRST